MAGVTEQWASVLQIPICLWESFPALFVVPPVDLAHHGHHAHHAHYGHHAHHGLLVLTFLCLLVITDWIPKSQAWVICYIVIMKKYLQGISLPNPAPVLAHFPALVCSAVTNTAILRQSATRRKFSACPWGRVWLRCTCPEFILTCPDFFLLCNIILSLWTTKGNLLIRSKYTSPTSKLVHNVDHSANYPCGNKSSESAKSKTLLRRSHSVASRKEKSQTRPHNVPTAPPPIQSLTHRKPDKTHITGTRIPEKQTIF